MQWQGRQRNSSGMGRQSHAGVSIIKGHSMLADKLKPNVALGTSRVTVCAKERLYDSLHRLTCLLETHSCCLWLFVGATTKGVLLLNWSMPLLPCACPCINY